MNAKNARIDILGAATAVWINAAIIGICALRLAGKVQFGHWLFGTLFLISAIPLAYLLYSAPGLHRPVIYYIWIGLMLSFIVLEFFLDWWPKVAFRDVRWMVIVYVMWLFGAAGGMIGVAAQAGRRWTAAAAVSFLAMGALAFIERAATGM